jgi:transposase-like protein
MTPAPLTPATETASRSRKVYSPQERADYLALFEQSAMSPADFCRELSLNEATFSLWRRQARECAGSTESMQFAEVQVSTTTIKATSELPVATLHLPGGARLEMSNVSESTWQGLGLLLKTLNA